MIIKVCIGSACHLKGSYDVILGIEKYIDDHNLNEDIILKSSFCLGQCSEAVSVEFNQGCIVSMSPHNIEIIMDDMIKG